MIRMIIADDDINMRFVLKKAVSKYEEVELVSDVGTGQEAVALFDEEKIDVAFLDVDMPGLNGVEAAKMILDINPRCAIVFITAHDDYMQDAFELYAFDYIMKPFKLERLRKTITRLLETTTISEPIEKDTTKKLTDELILKVKDGMVVIKKDDIVMVERQNRQTIINTTKNSYTINKSLTEVEAILDMDRYIRSHKSYIIRIDAIRALEIYGRWTYIVKFNGTEHDALITKEKAKEIEGRFDSFS